MLSSVYGQPHFNSFVREWTRMFVAGISSKHKYDIRPTEKSRNDARVSWRSGVSIHGRPPACHTTADFAVTPVGKKVEILTSDALTPSSEGVHVPI